MSWDTALNWAFLHFTDFKKRKYRFSFPIPSMQCCADVQATYGKQQAPQLWMEGTGEWCGFFCSLKLPHLSTILSPIVELSTTEKSWQNKPGNSLMVPLPPFPPQSYALVNLMETQEGKKVPVKVVNSIISESLDRKCTISLTYYKQKNQKVFHRQWSFLVSQ